MLEHTFLHIQGIGLKTERRMWRAGIRRWSDFCEPLPIHFSSSKAAYITGCLERSQSALEGGDIHYFTTELPVNQHWRIFPHFREKTAYLDIETTGMGVDPQYITAITLYDGRLIRNYVDGENMNDFMSDVEDYDVLVTYNGKSFDIPCIEQYFGIDLPQAQIDLRHVLNGLGLKGGLKACEKQVGINRPGLDGVNGYDAVLLWQEYTNTGSPQARETLLAYNTEDTVNLEWLMIYAFNRSLQQTPFREDYQLEMPQRPQNPFCPDPGIVEKLHRRWR